MSKPIQAVKVTSSTGRVFILRKPRISDTENAAQEVSMKANGDQHVLQILMQKVLVRNLIMKIDDVVPTPAEKVDMDTLVDMDEYAELTQAIGQMMGGDKGAKKFQVEAVSFGDKSPG